MPTMMFDWIVKNANTLRARSVGVSKNPVSRSATTRTWTTSPDEDRESREPEPPPTPGVHQEEPSGVVGPVRA